MATNFELTAAEREVMAEARRLLGDNLADFLLSGLGETSISHRRAFTAQSIPSPGEEVKYQLEMINDAEQGLPIEREPLVLALLLNLLWERQPLNRKIMFRERDILETFQWPLTSETKTLIKQSIEKYFLTAYYLVDPTIAEEQRSYNQYASFERLLIGYETDAVLLPQKRTLEQRLIKVQFSPDFIHDVISEKKCFLSLDFEKLHSLKQVSS